MYIYVHGSKLQSTSVDSGGEDSALTVLAGPGPAEGVTGQTQGDPG